MLTQSHIRHFGSYTPAQMEQMRNDLGFRMSVARLSFCANYYRTYEKRDPFIEELKMLDFLSEDDAPSPMSAAPVELLTNCSFIAETYADMMKKRHTLYPDAKTPCTFLEALMLAGAYLGRAGKEASLTGAMLSLEDNRYARLSHKAENYVGVGESSFGLRILKRQKRLPETGDFLVILRGVNQNAPSQYRAALNELWKADALTEQIKCVRTVGARGLLYELVTLTDAAYVDLTRLSVTGDDLPLTMLATAYEGDVLIRISPNAYEAFAKGAYALGIRSMAFATVTHGGRIVFAEGRKTLFSLEASFLRSLFPARSAKVKLEGEEHPIPAPIQHVPDRGNTCAYIAEQKDPAQALFYRGFLSSAAFCRPQKGFFLNALHTVLSSVLTLAASGCDYTAQRLSVGLSLPSDTSDPALLGETLATILGIYRLQAELGLPMASCKTLVEDSCNHPAITAFAIAEGEAVKDTLTGVGNHLYCVAPKRRADGLPDFAALRNMLDYIAKLRRRGALQGARVLCRETVTDGVRHMSTETLTCHFSGYTVVADGEMELALLIETTEKLPLTEVGVVVERKAPIATQKETRLPPQHILLPTDKVKITLLANRDDSSARQLLERCQGEGATVTMIDTDTELSALSRAILEGQTMIVCTEHPLPPSPQTDFALDTFRRGGGRIVKVGKGCLQKKLSGFAFENGIPLKILQQICKK